MGTFNSNILPSATGLDLGSTSQRWDGYFQTISVQNSNSVRMAENFSGSDCGIKVTAAFADMASVPGEVWVTQAAGLSQWSDVTIPTGCVLRFVQGGTYNIGRITLGNGSALVGQPSAMFDGTTNYIAVVLRSNISANGALTLSAADSVVQDLLLDGLNATSTAAGIKITGKRAELSRVAVWRFPSDNIQLVSTSTNNEAGQPKLFKVFSIASSGHNLSATNTTDGFVSNCEFENAASGKFGISLTASGSWRIEHSDIGGNGGGGLSVTGLSSAAALNGSFTQIIGNDFGNNLNHDILINGWDSVGGALSSTSNIIAANTFAGLGSVATDNTYDAIKLLDSGGNTVVGNTITSITSHRYKYGIESLNSSSTAGANVISGNCVNGLVGTSALSLKSVDIATGNTEYALGFGLVKNAYVANAENFNAKNASGTVQSIWTPLNASNDSIFNDTNVGRSFFFQINGTSGLQVQSTGITTPAIVLNGSQTLNGISGSGASLLTNNLPTVTGLKFPKTDITLANGANNDIALSGTTFARIVGPTAVFSVSGFAAGADGRVLYLFNSTNFAMTITNNATSIAANRIVTLTGADVTLRAGAPSFASFIYDSGLSVWVLMASN